MSGNKLKMPENYDDGKNWIDYRIHGGYSEEKGVERVAIIFRWRTLQKNRMASCVTYKNAAMR